MEIIITKGEREDRIEATRRDGTVARSTFAKKGPVPHDAVHFFVEDGLGISEGFWGMVAAGRHPDEIAGIAKAAGHASAKRAEAPAAHIIPIVQAERVVECFEADLWSGGSDNDGLRAMARAGCEQSLVPVPHMDDANIDRIRAGIAELRARWESLPAGESIHFEWREDRERLRA